MNLTPQYIIMLTGAALALAGVLLVALNPIPPESPGGTIDIALRDAKILTNHVGIGVSFLGAMLLIVGYLGPRLSQWFGHR